MAFFKFDINKLLTKLRNEEGKPVAFNTSQWAMVEGLEEHRFWVHVAGRRTGKSFAAAILALAKLLEPNTRIGIVSPTYGLSEIIWDFLVKMVKDLDLEVAKLSNKDRILALPNNSSVRLMSVNKREALIGRGYHLVIVDEAAIIEDDEYFLRDIRPTLSTFEDARCLFISTPRGSENYIHKYFLRGQSKEDPDWGSGLFTWRSNPRLRQSDIDEAKKTMTQSLFEQEYECSWVSFENMIYRIPPEAEVPKLYSNHLSKRKMEYIAGLDMGFRDETAFVVIGTDYEKYYIVDEFIVSEKTTGFIADRIKELEKLYMLQSIFIDSQAQQTRADLAVEHDIYCENSIKDVEAGIAFVQNLFEKGNILIDPIAAERTLVSLKKYKWSPTTIKQTPIHDKNSHCCDAVRYAIYSHQKTQVGIYTRLK